MHNSIILCVCLSTIIKSAPKTAPIHQSWTPWKFMYVTVNMFQAAYYATSYNDWLWCFRQQVEVCRSIHQYSSSYGEVIEVWTCQLHNSISHIPVNINKRSQSSCNIIICNTQCRTLSLCTYILSLNMKLNRRQQMAKVIPSVARMSKIITRTEWKVWMTWTGVPSGGGPPTYIIRGWYYNIKRLRSITLTKIYFLEGW